MALVPLLGVDDFESYSIWRADDRSRAAGSDLDTGPESSTWWLLAEYLIPVQGMFSMGPSADWTAGTTVPCGMPEQVPLTPSSGAENGWVGADAEITFSVPLPEGSSCDSLPSLGYPRHSGRFMIDLGSGPEHVESVGGAPIDPAPGHLYRYLVRGQDAFASFSWVDSLTSDNYGVLRITVEFIDPTDSEVPSTPSRRVFALQNVPDPFNPETTIRYVLPEQSSAVVDILDVRGRRLRELIAETQVAGYHAVSWNGRLNAGSTASSAVYFARITTPEEWQRRG